MTEQIIKEQNPHIAKHVLGDCALFNGDCLKIMKSIPDGSIDAIITDPPYGTTACKWDSVIPFNLMWEQLNRIIKSNGAIVLFGSEPFSSALRMSNIKNYKYDLIWEKNRPSGFAMANKRQMKSHENISLFYNKQPTFNKQLEKRTSKSSIQRMKYKLKGNISNNIYGNNKAISKEYDSEFCNPRSVIKIDSISNTGRFHPTQKPVSLMEYLIKTYTNENETVLDFTMGSGTTGVACLNLKRKFIGIEKDTKYYQNAKQRIENQIKLHSEQFSFDAIS